MTTFRSASRALFRVSPSLGAFSRSMLQPRRTHIYGVGAPKTGTKSVANMFGAEYRVVHEGLYAEAIEAFAQRRAGTASDADLAKWLRTRDVLLWAECESSHVLCWFSDLIKDVFPAARFIVTVRDCYSWTNSVIDQHLNHNPGDVFKRLRDLYYGPKSLSPGNPLTEHGEYTLEGYATYWAAHYTFLLDTLPPDRTLYVPTSNLKKNAAAIAAFADVPLASLDLSRAHSHVAPVKHDLLSELGPERVGGTIAEICGTTAERLGKQPGLGDRDLLGVPRVR